jgi:hypothetical protein
MNHAIGRRTGAALGLGILLLGASAAAQTPAAPAAANRLPRTREGKPDFSGIWQSFTTASWDIQDHPDSADMPPGPGIVENNEIPYKPEMRAQKQTNFESRDKDDLVTAACLMPGVPRAMYLPYPLQIFQDPELITIRHQFAHAVRFIRLAGTHPDNWPDFWMGDSRARWEGNSLVVDVRMIDERTWFDHAGNFHSPALHVVERYSEIDRDHLLYEATIEDADVFTRPWKISLTMYRRVEKNMSLMEHECQWFKSEQKYKDATPFKPPAKK